MTVAPDSMMIVPAGEGGIDTVGEATRWVSWMALSRFAIASEDIVSGGGINSMRSGPLGTWIFGGVGAARTAMGSADSTEAACRYLRSCMVDCDD